MQVVHEGIYISKVTGSIYEASVRRVSLQPFSYKEKWYFEFKTGWTREDKIFVGATAHFVNFYKQIEYIGAL